MLSPKHYKHVARECQEWLDRLLAAGLVADRPWTQGFRVRGVGFIV